MGEVVWFSTLLIFLLSCQGLETAYPDLTCYRDMAYFEAREFFVGHQRLEIRKDNTLNRAILCDTQTDGGGWIVIQRRINGDVDFYRNWNEYKTGFGTPLGDFWLGNHAIYELTNKDAYEMRIDFNNGNHNLFALYSTFKIESEANNYTLRLGSHSGTLGEDSPEMGLSYSNGMCFSTYDRDNDLAPYHCAERHHGAWWYNYCYASHLNGVWGVKSAKGMRWSTESEVFQFAKTTEMKIRRV